MPLLESLLTLFHVLQLGACLLQLPGKVAGIADILHGLQQFPVRFFFLLGDQFDLLVEVFQPLSLLLQFRLLFFPLRVDCHRLDRPACVHELLGELGRC